MDCTPIFGNTQIKARHPPPWRLRRGEYLRWLEADLKAARAAGKKWIIAGGHRPLVPCWQSTREAASRWAKIKIPRHGRINVFSKDFDWHFFFLGGYENLWNLWGLKVFSFSPVLYFNKPSNKHLGQDSTPPLWNDWVAWVSWPTLGWTNGVSFSKLSQLLPKELKKPKLKRFVLSYFQNTGMLRSGFCRNLTWGSMRLTSTSRATLTGIVQICFQVWFLLPRVEYVWKLVIWLYELYLIIYVYVCIYIYIDRYVT